MWVNTYILILKHESSASQSFVDTKTNNSIFCILFRHNPLHGVWFPTTFYSCSLQKCDHEVIFTGKKSLSCVVVECRDYLVQINWLDDLHDLMLGYCLDIAISDIRLHCLQLLLLRL